MDIDLLRAAFEENFSTRGELGASVCIWKDETPVCLSAGWEDRQKTKPWTDNTRVLVWSATKGPSAACVLHAMQQNGLTLEDPVVRVWPEFGQAGKGAVTIGQALSHQAGVPFLDAPATITDHDAVASALAAQAPIWEPGSAHGYSPRLHGALLEELVRRIDGRRLGDYWRQVFAEPMGLDFWIGLPAQLHDSVSAVFPPKVAPPAGDPFYTAYATAGTVSNRAFSSPAGFPSVAQMNSPEARSASLPATGGIGTALALAKFYGMLANDGRMEDREYFTQSTLGWMSTPLVCGDDQVLLSRTSFSAGFMMDPLEAGQKTRHLFGPSPRAFGHAGAGGSHAFADPDSRLGFAYVMNQMNPGVLPGEKALSLVQAVYA